MAKKVEVEVEVELNRWLSQVRKGSLELVVLASMWEDRHYGLEILQELAPLEIGEGTLYPLLNRLRREGLLDSEWETRETGHPRRYYRLTDAGRSRASAMVERWTAYNRELRKLMRPLLEEEGR